LFVPRPSAFVIFFVKLHLFVVSCVMQSAGHACWCSTRPLED
jgi:hypothetical protein